MAPSTQRRKVWLTPTTRVPCSNAAKTRNPLKRGGVPQTCQQISAASGPKFTILWRHVGETLLFKRFFPIVDMCLSCEGIARQICAMITRWRIFGDFWVLHFQRAAHISNLRSKFALGPHYVYTSIVDIECATAKIRRGKKEDRNIEETTGPIT